VTLPLLVSVPHAGLRVPPEVESLSLLTEREIAEDGDEGAAAVYDIAASVSRYVTTDIGRPFVDMNRAPDDIRLDGVVKTHTCWDVPVYREPLTPALVATLLARYHRPYHDRLTAEAGAGVLLGVDCHTMAAHAPPIDPRPGEPRPRVCLSNGDGTCPDAWFRSLAACLEDAFQTPVALNRPFRGGFIIRTHAAEIPWVQLELSREPFLDDTAKRERVTAALERWCRETGTASS
jgi:N-formylglutamate amidohydrolase